MLRISVICTVLNEGESVRRLLDSLADQTQAPDEVVIVDGGSTDQTVAILQEYAGRLPLRVLQEPGANISVGRNRAIAAATGDIIASTDAGVWLEPAWLERLVEPFSRPSTAGTPPVDVVSGFFVPDPHSVFERAMSATVLPALEDVNPATFLPSSRSVAFRKQAWQAAGGYPEWLDFCEDLVFDFELQKVAGQFAWAPEARAHFQPRGSLPAFFRQYYRYARGDGKADLWPRRHVIRYGTYLLALPVLLMLSGRPSAWRLLGVAGLIGGAVYYCLAPYRRLRRMLDGLGPLAALQAFLLVPIIRVVGDLAKMLGYPAGWVWRIQHQKRK